MKVTVSIVVYEEHEETLAGVLKDFGSLDAEKELIVVDNSPDDRLRSVCESFPDTVYLFPGKNLGFGAGHNLAFSKRRLHSEMHLIVNPDISFDAAALHGFLEWFAAGDEIALAVPKIVNPDGTPQYAVREIPTPSMLLRRRLNFFGLFDERIAKDEWRDRLPHDVTDIPFAHGAFLAFKTEVFEQLGGFDERFFMYMEDVDIFIRARSYGRTVIQPAFSVVHEHRRASAGSLPLLWCHLVSAIRFFGKYRRRPPE